MTRLIPLVLLPGAVLAHPGHDIAPTPEGLHHAASHADHLGIILGAAAGALVLLTLTIVLRHRRRARP
ncbi:hypothetical protein [Paracoccus lutimaris]|nr:hypothetical protein [Paracoccus lutimaris]